jgi:NADH-quinone oxidoreductase subunit K
MLSLSAYLIVNGILFVIGLAGIIINRKSLIIILMCVEMLLLAVNTNFLAFAHFLQNNVGEVFVFFILTVAAAETAIGLAILVVLYRNRGNVEVEKLEVLKG